VRVLRGSGLNLPLQISKKKKKHHTRLTTNTLIPLPHTRYSPLLSHDNSAIETQLQKNSKKTPPGLSTTTLAELSFFFKCLRTFQRSKLNFKKNPKKKPPGLPTTTLAELSFFFKCLRTFQRLLSTNKKPKKKDQLNVSHYFKQSGVGGASLLFESVFAS
jgi:hypothetical protein